MVRLREEYAQMWRNLNIKFQFLMVRLRANAMSACPLVVCRFQFLMVRLRGHKLPAHQDEQTHFNSLWFD